jgi:hypothetical protein
MAKICVKMAYQSLANAASNGYAGGVMQRRHLQWRKWRRRHIKALAAALMARRPSRRRNQKRKYMAQRQADENAAIKSW